LGDFGSVLKAKRARVIPSLLKRLLGKCDISRVKALQWGVNNEEEAIKAFMLGTGKTVKDTLDLASSLWNSWCFSRWKC